MIESLGYTIFLWLLLNAACGVIGAMIMARFNKAIMGALFGILLGPIGLIIVTLICQWEQANHS